LRKKKRKEKLREAKKREEITVTAQVLSDIKVKSEEKLRIIGEKND